MIDLTGKRFGRLQVIKKGAAVHEGLKWECLCDCGVTKTFPGRYLRTGMSTHCGCGKAPRKKGAGPISNAELLLEIERSKLSYCYFLEPDHATYDAWVHDLTQITPELVIGTGESQPIIRHYCYDHVPVDETRKRRGRERGQGHVKTNFPPFRHVRVRLEDGGVVIEEVGRSHWTGGLGNGTFSTTHGRMTNRLAELIWKMTTNYARRPNWASYTYREEMIGAALVQLMHAGLEFDESKTDNPFAYYTTSLYYSFLKVLQNEKKAADTRDQLLTDAGAHASQGWQDREYLKRFEPVKLTRKVGRPAKPRAPQESIKRPRGRPPKTSV